MGAEDCGWGRSRRSRRGSTSDEEGGMQTWPLGYNAQMSCEFHRRFTTGSMLSYHERLTNEPSNLRLGGRSRKQHVVNETLSYDRMRKKRTGHLARDLCLGDRSCKKRTYCKSSVAKFISWGGDALFRLWENFYDSIHSKLPTFEWNISMSVS